MPTVDDHKEAAKAQLRRLAQPDTEPMLDDVDLNSILDSVRRAVYWLASTAFIFGDVALPATKNGHRYVVLEGGNSGTTEPEWPTRDGAEVTDGTITWREAGPDYANVFDVRAAIQEAWLMKAAKATVLFDRDRQLYSQIAEHCRQMAESYDPVMIA